MNRKLVGSSSERESSWGVVGQDEYRELWVIRSSIAIILTDGKHDVVPGYGVDIAVTIYRRYDCLVEDCDEVTHDHDVCNGRLQFNVCICLYTDGLTISLIASGALSSI